MTADDARNAARVRQQEKVAWMKAVGADPNLSSAAARLGVMAALHLAYAKGYIYANRDELGQLSGLSVRSVTRAAAELAQQHYWRIDSKPGANKYTLVLPNDRLELWLEAERKWGSLARQWDAAKHDWEWRVTRWLETEAQHQWLEAEFWAKYEFTRDIAAAIRARGGDNGRARRAADNLWAGHQAGAVALEAAIQHIAAMPQGQFDERFREPEPTTFVPPMTPDGPPAGQRCPADDAGWPAAGTNLVSGEASTCVNAESFCPSRSDKTVQEHHAGAAMAPPGSHETSPRSPSGRSNSTAEGCDLCDADGVVRTRGGADVLVLSRWLDKWGADVEEKQLYCRHDERANVDTIRRELAAGWDAPWTGYPEIDGPEDADCEIGDTNTGHGIMEEETSPAAWSAQ